MKQIGCDEPILLDIDSNADLYVVEGWLTDISERQTVRLSKTVAFSAAATSIPVPDALLSVQDLQGNVFNYEYTGNGWYQSFDTYTGIAGRSYRLRVITPERDTIFSIYERFLTVSAIDSLWYDFFLDRNPEPPREEIQVYFPVIQSSDPVDQANFYWWRVFKNDSVFNSPSDMYLLSDRFFNGNPAYINNFPEFPFDIGDTMHMEINNISGRAFEFLNLVKSQTTSLGTNSGNSPATIRGNLTNISQPGQLVLGYFGVRSIKTSEKIVIESLID